MGGRPCRGHDPGIGQALERRTQLRSARAARVLWGAGAASVLVLVLGAAVVLESTLGVELVLEVPLVAGAPELGVMPEPEVV